VQPHAAWPHIRPDFFDVVKTLATAALEPIGIPARRQRLRSSPNRILILMVADDLVPLCVVRIAHVKSSSRMRHCGDAMIGYFNKNVNATAALSAT
jgi:hypothetical protein